MKVLTKELTGPALSWAVAKAEGYVLDCDEGPEISGLTQSSWGWDPSTKWQQGGPIIEREKIELHWDDGTWYAKHPSIRPRSKSWLTGPTALVAAMRVFVAYKVGSEVDIPEELLS